MKVMIKAASLFSGAGIGEYYLGELGIDIVLANEVVKSRAVAHSLIYPACEMITDDIIPKIFEPKYIILDFLPLIEYNSNSGFIIVPIML